MGRAEEENKGEGKGKEEEEGIMEGRAMVGNMREGKLME